MPRWSKITLKILGVLIGIVLVTFLLLALYVNINKKSLLQNITQELNKNLNGTMQIGSMDPTFLGGFPNVSLRLNNVIIKD
ncbi:MAG: hypothetical protein EOP04_19175, partial [Proteobacteria bacterium]